MAKEAEEAATAPAAPPAPAESGARPAGEPHVTFSDQDIAAPIDPSQSLLEWVDDQDVALDYECWIGMCGCDVVRIVSGSEHLNEVNDREAKTLERMTEPDRIIIVRVCWKDDEGQIRTNRAHWVQFNNAIMGRIHEQCYEYGSDGAGTVDYVKGANIAGFVKVADAMLAQGAV